MRLKTFLCYISLTLFLGLIKGEFHFNSNVVLVILSQSQLFYHQVGQVLKNNLLQQIEELKVNPASHNVYLSQEDFKYIKGAWTIFPTFSWILSNHPQEESWICFASEYTRVNYKNLLNILSSFDVHEELFLGNTLKDEEPTIIHHFFDEPNFTYPLFSSGFCLTRKLVQRISELWFAETDAFYIDPYHEFAKKIWELNITLSSVEEFCNKKVSDKCATWTNNDILSNCRMPIEKKDILFAVKTCKKYHKSRVPIVQQTWGKETNHIVFFSDKQEPSIPTLYLEADHVKQGFCAKTIAILKYYNDLQTKAKWIVIADDDTLLSISRLLKFLACFNSSEAIALGQRYGYAATESHGYDYLTGGSGMAFSMKAVEKLATTCVCPSSNAPDDMILGICLQRLGIPVTHSPAFHQARPNDYSHKLLQAEPSHISFHKHWMVDPVIIYKKMLSQQSKDEL